MKRVIVMGNSIAGIKAIEEIRKIDQTAQITLFTLEEHVSYYPHLLADLIANEISKDRVYYQPREYYQQLRVGLVEAKISRVNLKRRRITTEDKQIFDYDLLIIADTGVDKFPDIKGTHKDRVFSLRRFGDMNQFLTALPLVETVIIQSGGALGAKMACALKKRNKEVIWIVPTKATLPLAERNIRVMEEDAVGEILGDSEVKAIRLRSGKVIAAEAVIFGDTEVDLKLFKDSGLQVPNRISVNAHFQTNIENVFAINGACDSGHDRDFEDGDAYVSLLEQQGRTVAAHDDFKIPVSDTV